MKKYIFWGLGLILLVIAGGVGWWEKNRSGKEQQELPVAVESESGRSEEIPESLWPLTIPYLRERQYNSSLQVGEMISQTANYRAYMADYHADGFKIYGLLSVPTGEMPAGGWPAVILVHGYLNPATYQTNGTSYQAWWQTLANTGEFVVFKIDLRGHGQSQGVASGAYYSSTYVVDVLSARAALMASELVRAEAIGLWGHSMSGNVVLRALAARPEIPAVSLWAGAGYTYKDLATYRINDRSYVPQSPRPTPEASEEVNVRRQVFGAGETPPDYESPFWQAMIPTNFLNQEAGAIQLNHAVDDEVVNVGYSRDLSEILQQKGVEYQFFEYASGGHNLTGASFSQASGRMIEFFRKYLVSERG